MVEEDQKSVDNSSIKDDNSSSKGEVANKHSDNDPTDVEQEAPKKYKYPKSVFFIVSNEFCERFSFYGMRTILSLYLRDVLDYSESTSKIIFHIFTFLVYFFPTFGAIIADSWLGKFRTIMYVSCVYAVGNAVLAMAAMPPLNLPNPWFSFLGLLLIALGTGGIKPCVAAFGGDQFVLPYQEKQLKTFFSLFYFSINFGSFISTFITPLLRNYPCFDDETCFSLAFGVPGALMVVSIFVFILGKPLYIIKAPEGNIVLQVFKVITNSLKIKWNTKVKDKEHFIDYADESLYDKQLKEDVKAALRVLYLYIPLPIFWALYDQQGTAWTFQATRMDGDLGFVYLLPDQIQMINPILILGFIPLFEYVIYPLLAKCHLLTTPIQRITTGGMLAAAAFVISAFVAIQIESDEPHNPESGHGILKIYNTLNCPINYRLGTNGTEHLDPLAMNEIEYAMEKDMYIDINIFLDDGVDCQNFTTDGVKGTDMRVRHKRVTGFYIATVGKEWKVLSFTDSEEKSDSGNPNTRVIMSVAKKIQIVNDDNHAVVKYEDGDTDEQDEVTSPGDYRLRMNKEHSEKYNMDMGGVYNFIVDSRHGDELKGYSNMIEITGANEVHMLWIIPQYVVITMGEIMYSVTGLEFAFSQAPLTMKSLLQAAWLFTSAVGNLIIVLIEAIEPFEEQSNNFFLYAGIMVLDMLVFLAMAWNYKYVDYSHSKELDPIDDTAEVISRKPSDNSRKRSDSSRKHSDSSRKHSDSSRKNSKMSGIDNVAFTEKDAL